MAGSGTHYERAFEAYLERRGIAYTAVNQARKAVFEGVGVKSFDFLIYPAAGPAMLADVKGRAFSAEEYERGCAGPNWVTQADITGLERWQGVFGAEYRAVFVFAYWLRADAGGEAGVKRAFEFEGRRYCFYRVELQGYQRAARRRSERWGTVSVSAEVFRGLAERF